MTDHVSRLVGGQEQRQLADIGRHADESGWDISGSRLGIEVGDGFGVAGRKIDDDAVSTRRHAFGDRLGEEEHGADVDVVEGVELRDHDFFKGPVDSDTGMVDEDIDAAQKRFRLLAEADDLLDVGEVSLAYRGAHPPRARACSAPAALWL